MRAIHVTATGGPEVLKAVEVPEPEVARGTLRLRNRAIGVNFHDIHARLRGPEPDALARGRVEEILRHRLDQADTLWKDLVSGALALDRWPLQT